jgi:thiol-disulfide isomerase/thioredoxin
VKFLVFVLVLLLSVLATSCGAPAPPPSAPSALLQKPIPKFKRRTLAGSSVNTEPGQVVVVKFFAKYCEPCKKTLPVAERLHQENADVRFIGIAEDEYQADVDEMVQAYSLTFPIVHDRGNVLAGRFRVSEMPITFVADASGAIRWVGGEGQKEDDLEAAIAWVKSGAN